jgi:hypothetical protein
MVTPRTPRLPRVGRLRAGRALLACALLAGCTSIEGPTSDVDTWKQSWKNRAGAVADGAGRGAEAMGDSLGTAYQGVRDGFEEPAADAYGPYPERYASRIKHHMQRFEGVPEDASFQFGRPVKAYTNKGILAGGQIEWQGYVVDVQVETRRFGQKRSKDYVVRMRDDLVIEVVDADYASGIARLGQTSVPASRAH